MKTFICKKLTSKIKVESIKIGTVIWIRKTSKLKVRLKIM